MAGKKYYSLNPVSIEISNLDFTGNVIPHQWLFCKELRRKNGLINLPAVIVLADIVYWYRLVTVRDEKTGVIMGYKHKFAADKLQKYYGNWGKSLGLSKRQTQDAATFLRRGGFITIEFRTLILNGQKNCNVPFFEPVPEKIKKITQISSHAAASEGVPPITLQRDTPVPSERDTPLTLQCDTPITFRREYTETTITQTTTTRPTKNVVVTADKLHRLDVMTQSIQAATSETALSGADSFRVAQAMLRYERSVDQAREIIARIAWTYSSRTDVIRDPTAILVSAAKTGASRPAGYQSSEERKVQEAVMRKALAQKKAAEQARQKEEQKQWDEAVKKFRDLTENQRQQYMARYSWMSSPEKCEAAAIGAYMRSLKMSATSDEA